ncbi:hypothetical protein [Fangia hongkongensis]|uniref:hypothetical protein n=3 Tax=Fangia hongkongensis TaxID=270495 RepID=UPI0003652D5A|nr:hypothetical protein [Fangia hongkongensis]
MQFTLTNHGESPYDLKNIKSFPSKFTTFDKAGTTCLNTLNANESCQYSISFHAPVDQNEQGKLYDIGLEAYSHSKEISSSYSSIFVTLGSLPTKVVVLYNSDATHTIYPVIETSRKIKDVIAHIDNPDTWLMTYFGHQKTAPIYTSGVYRVYVGGLKGIAPHHYAMVAVPLYSEFKEKQKNNDLYIDWWRGTRIYMYDNPSVVLVRMGQQDKALAKNTFVSALQDTRVCEIGRDVSGCHNVKSVVYQDKLNTSFPNNDPMQLIEYTFGSDGGNNYKWNAIPVDYDISYVDNIYLGLALGRVNYLDRTLGWVGTDMPISTFQDKIKNSLLMNPNTDDLWPKYIDSERIEKSLKNHNERAQIKVPSLAVALQDLHAGLPIHEKASNGLNFQLNRKANDGHWVNTSLSSQWQFIKDIQNAWRQAINTRDGKIIWDAFEKNYNKNCPNSQKQLTLSFALTRIIGFVDFANCMDEKQKSYNYPLPDSKTPEGKALINAYHRIMYANPALNPWVAFIHQQMGLKYAYGFSIDDAYGNVETIGDGVVVDVSGNDGLENHDQQLPVKQTIAVHYSPVNLYEIHDAVICGNKVQGNTQSKGTKVISYKNTSPIYLSELTDNKCVLSFNGTRVQDNKDFKVTVKLPNISQSISEEAFSDLFHKNCKDTLSGLFCRTIVVNKNPDAQGFLFDITFPA